MTFDPAQIQSDFPALQQIVNDRRVVFLDSAASSQKPLQVLDAMSTVYQTCYANVHRGLYRFSDQTTTLYEAARAKVAAFIGAPAPETVVFTRNATEALNLIAFSYARAHLSAGDEIVISELEHHANFLPWWQLKEERGIVLKFIPLTPDGHLDLSKLDALLTPRTKLVSFAQVSNVLGTVTDPGPIIAAARAVGAKVIIDGSQSVPHMPVDVAAMDCDFLVFSGHKMLGPTGIGVLYAKAEILNSMVPFMTGGDMILSVGFDSVRWNEPPYRFEAGTPAFVEAIGLGAAVDYLSELGMDAVLAHDREMMTYALGRLSEVPGLTLLGPSEASERCGAVSFVLNKIHPHDLSSLCDEVGVAIRAGYHCAQPLHDRLGLGPSARASFYVYTQPSDIDGLIEGIYHAKHYLRR